MDIFGLMVVNTMATIPKITFNHFLERTKDNIYSFPLDDVLDGLDDNSAKV